MRLDRSRAVALLAIPLITLAGCGGDDDPLALPDEQAEQYATAYLARAEPAPDGDDLVDGGGEYVVIANNADIRVDMGGWWIDDTAGNRLNLGIGRQIDVGAELKVYSSCGESTDEAVFACAGVEVLDDDGDVLTLRDSAGTEVAELRYDDGAE